MTFPFNRRQTYDGPGDLATPSPVRILVRGRGRRVRTPSASGGTRARHLHRNRHQAEIGKELKADIIVTATGLNLEILGGTEVTVDGRKVEFGKAFTYKGLMFSGVPNLAAVFGYTNASWTHATPI